MGQTSFLFCEHKLLEIFFFFYFEKIRKSVSNKNIKVILNIIFSKKKQKTKQAQFFGWKRWDKNSKTIEKPGKIQLV